MAEKFEQAKSSLESVKDHIGKLRREQESLFEKRERNNLQDDGSLIKEDLRLERT